METRPTSDRVREALFNILAHHDWGADIGKALKNAVVLDAFAGTGALGLEALSRGATTIFFFEKDKNALKTLQQNIAHVGAGAPTTVLPIDVKRAPSAKQAASLVFLDPPYHKGLIEKSCAALAAQGWFAPHALLICETAKDEVLETPDGCALLLSRAYGDTLLHFYKWFS
jgi:16S rRNA (guanine966-N2)-methyltransferase